MLWRGMLPALYRHAIYTGTRMTAYEEIRASVTKHNKDGFPMWKKVRHLLKLHDTSSIFY